MTTERPTANTPSEALRLELCPACLGHGWVHRFVPEPHEGPCSGCGGDGTLDGFWAHQDFLYDESLREFGPPDPEHA